MSKQRINLNRNDSLADLIKRAKEEGIKEKDFDKVIFDADYVSGCSGHSDGEYCYCESGYTDLRFVFDKK